MTLREPFPSGPTDPSLLCNFKAHIAADIWFGEEQDVFQCFCHTTKLLEWRFEKTKQPGFGGVSLGTPNFKV